MKPDKLIKQYQKIKAEYDQWELAYNTYQRMLRYQSQRFLLDSGRQAMNKYYN